MSNAAHNKYMFLFLSLFILLFFPLYTHTHSVPSAVSIMLDRLCPRLMPRTAALGGRSTREPLAWAWDGTSGGPTPPPGSGQNNTYYSLIINPQSFKDILPLLIKEKLTFLSYAENEMRNIVESWLRWGFYPIVNYSFKSLCKTMSIQDCFQYMLPSINIWFIYLLSWRVIYEIQSLAHYPKMNLFRVIQYWSLCQGLFCLNDRLTVCYILHNYLWFYCLIIIVHNCFHNLSSKWNNFLCLCRPRLCGQRKNITS